MAMDIDSLIEWAQEVKSHGIADGIAIDDGGLTLVALKNGNEETGACLEIGGIPLDEDLEDEYEEPGEIYLTNGCGENCGNVGLDFLLDLGLEVDEKNEYPLTAAETTRISDEVTFPETGDLGWMGLYTTLIGNRKYHTPTVEIPYKDEWWGDEAGEFPEEDAVREEAAEIRRKMMPWAASRGGDVVVEEDMPGRINVRVRYPLDHAKPVFKK